MIQGGDPTATGSGGHSCWHTAFPDEFDTRLSHDQRGILSMANSGKDSNLSQFFITFAPQRHLNHKHTVFGRMVGGFDTLEEIERTEVHVSRPKTDIVIEAVQVFENPFHQLDQKPSPSLDDDERGEDTRANVIQMPDGQWIPCDDVNVVRAFSASTGNDDALQSQALVGGIGKYLATGSSKNIPSSSSSSQTKAVSKIKKNKGTTTRFSDFSAW